MTPQNKKSIFEDSSVVSIAFKIIGALAGIVVTGLIWWMTVVWGNQVAQADEISSIKTRLAVLENKVDGVSNQVTDVKSGIDQLVKLALKRAQ